jgi:geranylgeranyl pyrophosphate synthase
MTQPAIAFDLRPLSALLLEEQFPELVLAHGEPVPWQLWEQALYGPLADFLARPGKELRAELVAIGWELGGGRGEPPLELCGVVEALHAGSLVIDDIEDGSAYRRGAPALHCAYGVPQALNAGCWLYFWPHALLERLALPAHVELAARKRIGQTLLAAHAGQALDLGVRIFEVEQPSVPELVRALTRLKTGSLTELALSLGALAAGARSECILPVQSFGGELGVGLQMYDDLGGLLRESRCHKGHEDLLQARATWPWAWLARELCAGDYARVRELGAEAHARSTHPEQVAEALRARLGDRPEARVRQHLAGAVARLDATCASASAISRLERLIEEMEAAYV